MAENILNNLCTAVISLDHELKVCFINQSAESLLEISASKSLDKPLAELVRGFDQYMSIFYDAIQSGQPYTQRMAEFTLTPGTHLTLDFTISPISEGEWRHRAVELIHRDGPTTGVMEAYVPGPTSRVRACTILRRHSLDRPRCLIESECHD